MTGALVLALVVGAAMAWPVRDRSGSRGADPKIAGGRPGGGGRSARRGMGAPGRGWPPPASGRRLAGREDWVADLAEVVAVGLRAGLDLPGAVRVAARSPTVATAEPAVGRVLDGSDASDLVGRLEDLAREQDAREAADLRVIARAWRLALTTGAPAAATTGAAAAAVRARVAAHQRTVAALAGPRASMRLLTLLPLGGPVLTAVVGLDPTGLYAGGAARVSAGLGLGLTALGWWWASALLRRAARPATTGPSP